MQTVESIRSRRAALDAQIERVLGIDHTVEELTEIYRELGDEVDEDVLRQATELYGDKVMSFRPPAPSGARVLARMWTRRFAIGIPILVSIAVVGVVFGGVGASKKIAAKERRARLGTSLDSFCRRVSSSGNRLERLERRLEDLSPQVRADAEASATEARAEYNNLALGDLCVEDRAPIPPAVAEKVDTQLRAAQKGLNRVDKLVGEGDKLVRVETDLKATRANLDKTLAELRDAGAPTAVLAKAQQAHHDGGAAIDARDVAGAKEDLRELRAMVTDYNAVERLGPEATQVMARIERVSRDPAATQDARQLRDRAVGEREAVDADALRQTVAEMRDVLKRLESEYTLVIFGGDWRFPHDNPSAKNHYLLVEAHRGSVGGEVLRQSVFNEETGETARVCGWGERVPEAQYEAVKRDKTDNGLIDNNVFGVKRVGYLTPDYTEGFTPIGGQITSWDRGSPAKVQCQ